MYILKQYLKRRAKKFLRSKPKLNFSFFLKLKWWQSNPVLQQFMSYFSYFFALSERNQTKTLNELLIHTQNNCRKSFTCWCTKWSINLVTLFLVPITWLFINRTDSRIMRAFNKNHCIYRELVRNLCIACWETRETEKTDVSKIKMCNCGCRAALNFFLKPLYN